MSLFILALSTALSFGDTYHSINLAHVLYAGDTAILVQSAVERQNRLEVAQNNWYLYVSGISHNVFESGVIAFISENAQ